MQTTSPERLIMGTMRLGSWGAGFTPKQYLKLIETCVDAGVTTFDLADIYGDYTTEGEFGAALAKKPKLRQQIKLITKCGIRRVCEARPAHQVKSYDSGKKHILRSVENSLRALGTDYLDQLLLHRPDLLMDPMEVAETFHELQKQGKVKEFGVSNFSPSQVALLHDQFPLVAHQVEASILQLNPFENGVFDQCQRLSLSPQAWSPLGGGKLFQPQISETREGRIVEALGALQFKYDATGDQLMLAFLLRHPAGLRPVLGTTRSERIHSAVKALQINLEKEDWYYLWQASTGERIP